MTRFFKFFLTTLLILNINVYAKYPDLTPQIVNVKAKEILGAHATQKKITPELAKRILNLYVEMLDPTKTYFIRSDIQEWIEPSDSQLQNITNAMNNKDYSVFKAIYDKMASVIPRHSQLMARIDMENLPKNVSAKEFKDLVWLNDQEQLQERLTRIRALQLESSAKLAGDLKEKAIQRIEKRQQKYEEEILTTDPKLQNNLVLTYVLKSISGALDAHTTYFTPEEATQFLIQVQQRLFGIGAQLRDDLNGFTVVKLVEGGPAARSEVLKVKDRIIAVNGEPVVGMDIVDAVQLIRGPENSPVVLTVIRDTTNDENITTEEKLDVTIKRGEVVLTESRYESSYEPVGDEYIAYLRLYSFYQDPDSCSTSDLKNALNKIRKDHKVAGVILDLRNNSGGILAQAVGVAGLFITKGIVVSIVDDKGNVQHLRNMDPTITWDGPLIVLINRGSASASEIVAGALQDYGRGLIIGDDHSYGKGSFQTFTLNGNQTSEVNPAGEFKVTRGRYYTVSGKTPQLIGVPADIIVPGPLSEAEVGEKFTKYPLENDQIKSNFVDDLSDIPIPHRQQFKIMYHYNLQPQLHVYDSYIPKLKDNSQKRIDSSVDYQAFLKEIKTKQDIVEGEDEEDYGKNDLQLKEAYNIMKDLILLERN
jgi:carboxyl-terminal processing protease